jgi:hypothetical protein
MYICRYLVCESEPTKCIFGPDNTHVVIAGTKAGNVALWDLREFSYLHPIFGIIIVYYIVLLIVALEVNGESLEIQYPTYSTDSLYNENHSSPVVKIMPLPNAKQIDEDEVENEPGLFIARCIIN